MVIYPILSGVIFAILYCLSHFIASVNIVRSSEYAFMICSYLILYLGSTLFAIKPQYVYKLILALCLASSILYLIYFFSPSFVPFLTPTALQFIIPVGTGHNHLGDLVGMGIILQGGTLLSLFFIGIMVVSFSKSAFLALLVTLFVMVTQKKIHRTVVLMIGVISLLSVGLYSKEISHIPQVAHAQSYMTSLFHLTPKPILSSRDVYALQIIKSWTSSSVEHSFFGFGPGNFFYASAKSARIEDVTFETHNFPLTIFMESGALPTFWFLIFFGLTIGIGLSYQTNSMLFLIIYLFTNFQTDYTYRIPLFLALFFILSGQICAPHVQKKERSIISFLLISMSLLCFYFAQNTYFLKQKVLSLNSQIDALSLTKNQPQFIKAAQELEALTPYDETLLVKLSTYYAQIGLLQESIRLLQQLSLYSPHKYLTLLPHLFDQMKKEQMNIQKYIKEKKKDFSTFPFSQKEKKELNNICEDYAKMKCIN